MTPGRATRHERVHALLVRTDRSGERVRGSAGTVTSWGKGTSGASHSQRTVLRRAREPPGEMIGSPPTAGCGAPRSRRAARSAWW
jgi:hypothetical protein